MIVKGDMVDASPQHAKLNELRQQLGAMNQELLELKNANPHASMKIARNFLEATLNGY